MKQHSAAITPSEQALADAVGQKLMLSFEGATPAPELLATLESHEVAGVTLFRAKNVVDAAQVRELTAALQRAAASAGRTPLLIGADQEGGQLMAIDGGMTRFPGNLALGATGSAELAYRNGLALGRELAAVGVNVNYAPSCDVNSNPRNPVIGIRSFGEDPAAVGALAAAMVRGMQAAGVAATAKHFPGHGDTAGDTHDGAVVLPHDAARLRAVELPPFAAAIGAGARLVMSAHLATPALNQGLAIPATLSPALLSGILRTELGFAGLVISDAMDMHAIAQDERLAIDAIAASSAGVDLLLLGADPARQRLVAEGLRHAARRGLLQPAALLASAARVLELKRWLAAQPQPDFTLVGCAEHRALAFEIAARAATLVRDDAGLLPLRLAPEQRVAVIVPRPIDLTPADTSSYIRPALAAALRRHHPAVGEIELPFEPSASDIAGARAWAASYDLVIVATISAAPGGAQAALVRALLAGPAPVVALALRTPYDLAAYPEAPTYACSYGILPPSIEALALALLGHIPFGGRLPVSIPGLYPLGHSAEPRAPQAPAPAR
ncbi:glycoside hydrolase family 3 protein [Kouleothrix sp.]|uniref:glycoside hydrolase family 3 protein n=1 Tax=Kouleothrix sp. TaxID=2779161 RepID=UPI00391BB518